MIFFSVESRGVCVCWGEEGGVGGRRRLEEGGGGGVKLSYLMYLHCSLNFF